MAYFWRFSLFSFRCFSGILHVLSKESLLWRRIWKNKWTYYAFKCNHTSHTLVMKFGLNVASIPIICGLNNLHNPHNPDWEANNPEEQIIQIMWIIKATFKLQCGIWFQVFQLWLLCRLYGFVTIVTAATFSPQCGFSLEVMQNVA